MPFEPQTRRWTGKRAVLLVHGIGNSRPGDDATLTEAVRQAFGDDMRDIALYPLYYDHINDWFSEKTNAAALLSQATSALATRIADPELGATLAEYVGDVLWPVLSTSARSAIREAFLAQLKQITEDGEASGVPIRRQRLTIVAHSLGCFHTYEALHHAAAIKTPMLRPASNEMKFANVIFMASPVQLIRSVAEQLGSLVPNRRWLYAVQGDGLSVPFEEKVDRSVVRSVDNWISITGNLDPVGGHFFRSRADWAYMDVPGQQSIVVPQFATDVTSRAQLLQRLSASSLRGERPTVSPQDPHSWLAYVSGHASQLREWVMA